MPKSDQKEVNRIVRRVVQNYGEQRAASRPQEEPGEYRRKRESVHQEIDPVTGG